MANSRKSPVTDIGPTVLLKAAVRGCLDRWTNPGQRLAVGLSGGLDSVVLLHALRRYAVVVSAVHINHGLSPHADAWQEFCERLCADLDVALHVERVTIDCRSHEGLEGAARRARHAVYERAEADWIFLAHHRGDQAETVLLQLLRGAGVRGAAAMAERRGRVLRPLLSLPRSAIADYAKVHGLSWIEDDSNTDLRFARNFLRHRILPELDDRFPAAEKKLADAARHFAEAQALLDGMAQTDLRGGADDFPVAVSLLAALPEPRARNVLRYLLGRRGAGVPSEERLVEALRQFLTAAPDRHPSVRLGPWRLFRRRGQIELDLLEKHG